MKQTDIGFWPNTLIQWIRFGIAVVGLFICSLYFFCKFDFEILVGIVSVLSFLGYLIESLNTNIEERKKTNK